MLRKIKNALVGRTEPIAPEDTKDMKRVVYVTDGQDKTKVLDEREQA